MGAIVLGLVCPLLSGHSSADANHLLHARTTAQPNGKLLVEANSRWPLYQAVSALARCYGLLVDYEDPWYRDQRTGVVGRRKELAGAYLRAEVPRITDRSSETTALRMLIRKYREQSGAKFRLARHGARRFDVIGVHTRRTPLLDTRIVLERKERTVDDAVQEIVRHVEQRRGVRIVRGGLANTAVTQTLVVLGGPETRPARDYLVQALDSLNTPAKYVLIYDPDVYEPDEGEHSGGHFGLGIEGMSTHQPCSPAKSE